MSQDFLDIQYNHISLLKVMLLVESKFLADLFKISAEKQSPSGFTDISLPGVPKHLLTKLMQYLYQVGRGGDPNLFSSDPAQLGKKFRSGLNSKGKIIYIFI